MKDDNDCPISEPSLIGGRESGLAAAGMDLTGLTSCAGFTHALGTVREIDQFLAAFPEPDMPGATTPGFLWEQLERQLKFLAGTPQRQAMVGHRVASIRKYSGHKPEEMVLQEILIEAWVLLDEESHAFSQAE